jgi:hypothetical protein
LLCEALPPFTTKLPGANANDRYPESRFTKATIFHEFTSWDVMYRVKRDRHPSRPTPITPL